MGYKSPMTATDRLRARLLECTPARGDMAELARQLELPRRSLQMIAKDGVDPALSRAEVICPGIGWELYVGPPRRPNVARSGDIGAADPDLAELVRALRLHWERLDGDYARRTWLAHLRLQFPELAGP